MFGMLGLVSAKAWPSDLLREVDWWYLVGLEGAVHLLKSDVDILVLEITLFLKHCGDLWSIEKSCVWWLVITWFFSFYYKTDFVGMVNKTVWEWLNLKSLWNSLIFLDEEHDRLFAGIIRLWQQFNVLYCIELDWRANCWFAVHSNILDWTAAPTLQCTALHW